MRGFLCRSASVGISSGRRFHSSCSVPCNTQTSYPSVSMLRKPQFVTRSERVALVCSISASSFETSAALWSLSDPFEKSSNACFERWAGAVLSWPGHAWCNRKYCRFLGRKVHVRGWRSGSQGRGEVDRLAGCAGVRTGVHGSCATDGEDGDVYATFATLRVLSA